MGEKMTRLASYLGPPWVSEPERLPNERVLAEFTGLWAPVYVTERWLIIRSLTTKRALKHAWIADVDAGLDPSPHDNGGPLWGIWLTMTNGEEHGVGLFHAREAGDLIQSLASAARRQKRKGDTYRG
jgi:hypothetical protein